MPLSILIHKIIAKISPTVTTRGISSDAEKHQYGQQTRRPAEGNGRKRTASTHVCGTGLPHAPSVHMPSLYRLSRFPFHIGFFFTLNFSPCMTAPIISSLSSLSPTLSSHLFILSLIYFFQSPFVSITTRLSERDSSESPSPCPLPLPPSPKERKRRTPKSRPNYGVLPD